MKLQFFHQAVNRKQGVLLRPMMKAPTENLYKCILDMPIPFIKIYLHITHKVVEFVVNNIF